MPIIITNFFPTTGSIYGGGTLIINGTGLTTASGVTLANIPCPPIQFVDNGDSTQTLYVQIPPTMTAGAKAIVVSGMAAGTWTAKNPDIFKPDFPYSILLNNNDVTNLQKDRIQLIQSMNIIDTYSLGFNSIVFDVPIEMSLYKIPPQNNIIIKQGNVIYFQGYPSGESNNEITQIKKITCTPFLNLLSKFQVAYSDTDIFDAKQLIINRFTDIVSSLPKPYNVFPWIINGSYLDGIKIGVTGNGYGIEIFKPLFELLHIGVYLWNDTLFLFAVPENLLAIPSDDITNFLIAPPSAIDCMDEYYYDIFTLNFTLPGGAGNNNVSAGAGSLAKKLTASGLLIDTISAQLIVNRNYNLLNQVWKKTSFDITKNCKIGDYLGYNDYVFIVTSVQEKYNSYGIKAIGLKKE